MSASDQTHNQSDDEVMRKRVVPPEDGDTRQDDPDRSPTDEETTRGVTVKPLSDGADDVNQPIGSDTSDNDS